MSTQEVTASEPDQSHAYAWSVHPASDRPGATIAVGGVILAAMVVLSFESFWWSAFAAATFFFTLNRYFLPTRFEINDEGIVASYPLRTLRLKWSQVRRCVMDDRGGHLSMRRQASSLDTVSGIHIQFGPDHDAPKIRAMIHERFGAARAAVLERHRRAEADAESGSAEGVPA